MSRKIAISFIAMGAVLGATAPLGAVSAADQTGPAEKAVAVVKAFNEAFGRKDIDGLAAHLVEGGVQFDLRPAHADQNAPQGLTQELTARWYGVTPILFAATQSYTRNVEVLDSRATPDMATVWTRITTEMRMPKSDAPSLNSFTEVYLLVHTPKGWRIGAMIDDRATDTIATATPAPTK